MVEGMLYLDDVVSKHSVPPPQLKQMIEATIKAREKKAREDRAEDRQRDQPAERARETVRCEQREQERKQKELEREAERKRRERQKEFTKIAKLPRICTSSGCWAWPSAAATISAAARRIPAVRQLR